MGRLDGKVAFISGGARGMGAEEARLFAREGAKVAIGDILDDDGHAVEAEINESGGDCLYIHLDVTGESNWQDAIAATVSRFGRLDILVNNAGIGGMGGLIEDTAVEDWERVLDINGKGVFLGTKAAIPAMQDSGGGSIINISSQLGIVATDITSAQYHASKGAVRILTKSTAIQFAPDGIRANSIHPGPVATPMTESRRGDPSYTEVTLSRIPLGRFAEPIEIANVALYLASDESGYVTGSEVVVDGGWVAQ
ncbi:MAG: glucose 1-dehydrogenase [Chloroflexi bacterium]|nr:glucose 1-dehydrogenase [Chloroflexota bacterium]